MAFVYWFQCLITITYGVLEMSVPNSRRPSHGGGTSNVLKKSLPEVSTCLQYSTSFNMYLILYYCTVTRNYDNARQFLKTHYDYRLPNYCSNTWTAIDWHEIAELLTLGSSCKLQILQNTYKQLFQWMYWQILNTYQGLKSPTDILKFV
jgi:hypothetical protein